jgi:hypothetical protein
MKKNINNLHKITVSMLSFGVLVAPVQSAFSNISLNVTPHDGVAQIHVEYHPHASDSGSWHNHYIDPRSIRAVGYDTGKTHKNHDNWDFYRSRVSA